ncbi:uncharacterized protein [Lepeophtheirus salmonis]|uniref:THAP-type domain-containing protein n=1 Tax=Lepeophtheirus salmonis TaxID=72036 RepID=A0A0K2TD49_LEPSM|nr:uncharacterized protein LOC121131784 [Lepeophtheirus salmonis]
MFCYCPGCNSNTKSGKKGKTDPDDGNEDKRRLSFHSLPKDEDLREKWLRLIPRENWKPSKYAKICNKHFEDSCFETETCDKNIYRKKTISKLRRRKLKPYALPTQFPGFSSDYAESIIGHNAELPSLPSVRSANEENQVHKDKVRSLKDLEEKLDRLSHPENIQEKWENNQVVFYSVLVVDHYPKISFSLTIDEDLKYFMKIGKLPTPSKEVAHICSTCKINRASDVKNILFYLSNFTRVEESSSTLEHTVDLLENLSEKSNHLKFIKEQLALHSKPICARRYSFHTLNAAMVWQATSPALYKQLVGSELIILPSEKHLKRLTSKVEVWA